MPLFDRRLIKFLVVGVSNAIVSYLAFLFSYHVIIPGNILFSQPISYGVGIVWSYIWNRTWTFESTNKVKHEFHRFTVIQITLLVASTGFLYVVVDIGNINASVGWILVMSLITIANYYLTKNVAFRRSGGPS